MYPTDTRRGMSACAQLSVFEVVSSRPKFGRSFISGSIGH